MIIRASASHIALKDNTVHQVVCSPPYYGMRRYDGLPDLIWGGTEDCEHDFVTTPYYTQRTAAVSSAEAFSEPGQANIDRLNDSRHPKDTTCRKCGSWKGQLGLERDLTSYLQHLVEVFREVKRILRPEGTLWLNCASSFHSDPAKGGSGTFNGRNGRGETYDRAFRPRSARKAQNYSADLLFGPDGWRYLTTDCLKPKDDTAQAFLVALALRADGWYFRGPIIWEKPSCLPSSQTDRPTVSHEYIFLLSKSSKYYYDLEAVKEPAINGSGYRSHRTVWRINSEGNTWAVCKSCHYVSDNWPKCTWCGGAQLLPEGYDSCPHCRGERQCPRCRGTDVTRHFASYPQALIEPIITPGRVNTVHAANAKRRGRGLSGL